MPKSFPDIEKRILELLLSGPIRQVDIVDAFPLDAYLAVGRTIRDMAARGLIDREKAGATYIVTRKDAP